MATRYEYLNTGNTSWFSVGGTNATDAAQTFLSTNKYRITSVKLYLQRVGSPGTVNVGIYATSGGEPTGSALCSGSINGDILDTSLAWIEITLGSGYILSNDTTYAIVLSVSSSGDNYCQWARTGTDEYADGQFYYSTTNRSSWNGVASWDLLFENWGEIVELPSSASIQAVATMTATSLIYKKVTAAIEALSTMTASSLVYKKFTAVIEAIASMTAKGRLKKRYPPGVVEVTGIQYGEVLTRGRVPPYSKAIADGVTVSQVLQAFLNYQETARITLGTVSPTLDQVIAISFTDWPTILESCRRVRDIVGGYLDIEIDSTNSSVRELTLRDSIGSNTGQEIRLTKNLSNIKHTQDWMKYANKLIAVGTGNLLLDTITYTAIPVNQERDATHARLKLQQLYGAYKGWTGDGDAVPAHVTITKPSGAWDNPFTSHSTSGWSSPENAYDGNVATLAQQGGVYSGGILPGADSTEFVVICPDTTTDKIRLYLSAATQVGSVVVPITVKLEIGGVWTTLYYGYPGDVFNQWYTVDIGSSESITGVSVQFHNWTANQLMVRIYEIETWNTTGSADDTANWTQGEDERTFKQALASYDDVPHLLSYTHAAYIINADELLNDAGTVDRDRVALSVLKVDTDDVDELLMRARTALEEDYEPTVTIDVGMVDLSEESGRDFELLELGNTVKVIHGGLDISETVQVYGIKKDLINRANVEVEIGNIRDILDEM